MDPRKSIAVVKAAADKPVRRGVATSEWWISLAAVLAGAFVASGVVPSDHWAVKVAGLVVTAAAALGYTASRTFVKRG